MVVSSFTLVWASSYICSAFLFALIAWNIFNQWMITLSVFFFCEDIRSWASYSIKIAAHLLKFAGESLDPLLSNAKLVQGDLELALDLVVVVLNFLMKKGITGFYLKINLYEWDQFLIVRWAGWTASWWSAGAGCCSCWQRRGTSRARWSGSASSSWSSSPRSWAWPLPQQGGRWAVRSRWTSASFIINTKMSYKCKVQFQEIVTKEYKKYFFSVSLLDALNLFILLDDPLFIVVPELSKLSCQPLAALFFSLACLEHKIFGQRKPLLLQR